MQKVRSASWHRWFLKAYISEMIVILHVSMFDLFDHSLVHWHQLCVPVLHLPKCMRCHEAIGGSEITGRAHCPSFLTTYTCIYIHTYIHNICVYTILCTVGKNFATFGFYSPCNYEASNNIDPILHNRFTSKEICQIWNNPAQ